MGKAGQEVDPSLFTTIVNGGIMGLINVILTWYFLTELKVRPVRVTL